MTEKPNFAALDVLVEAMKELRRRGISIWKYEGIKTKPAQADAIKMAEWEQFPSQGFVQINDGIRRVD